MKTINKLAIMLSATILCSAMTAYAQSNNFCFPINSLNNNPIYKNQILCSSKSDCNCKKDSCEKCKTTPVFNSCEELQQWKIKYFEKRCKVYTKLGLNQEQRIKAKNIDEKFFDEIAPLKLCCEQEKAKLKEMRCNKCSLRDRHEQKEKINDLKDEIKAKKKQHNECFEKLLSKCQKDLYKDIKKDKSCCK
jgi:hypothetical protein